MPNAEIRLLFADSNVFIEDLFIKDSAAALVMNMVAAGSYRLCTCKTVIDDVERTILNKLRGTPDQIDQLISNWHDAQTKTKLEVLPDTSAESVRRTYAEYIALMRHRNDIPILACALEAKPYVLLSGNREHFNDKVAAKAGIAMLSCEEFLQSAKPT